MTRSLTILALTSAVISACGSAPSAPGPTTTTPTTTTQTPAGTFFDSTGARIAYVIDRPTGAGPFPGIVLVHEGGVVTKDDLAVSAAALVGQGFMVLRYDKRGTGLSTGGFSEVTTDNSVERIGLLAADAAAAVQTLKAATGINASKIGLVGVSQAGWVMPLAATLTADVKFIAAVCGPTVAVGPLYYYAAQAADASKDFNTLSGMLAAYTGPTGFDPRPSFNALSIPILYQFGTSDRVVPTRESVAVLNALIAAGKPVTVQQFAGGHELRETTNFVADLFAWLALRK